ncbi:MAG: metallophosphoesterase, partial [Nannocystaceae bacterium]|nr:metallophosphoesterase [Nannocystaceae bacterium]
MTVLVATVALCATCNASLAPLPPDPPIVVDRRSPECTVAVIGDYGDASPSEAAVAALVHGWQPDLVVTLGDNNYPRGSARTIDANIGQYYHRYIAPYRGTFGKGAASNRFFPSLGNHDWRSPAAAPYLEYFDLPGNERYYDVRWGPVHFFALDSDRHEPDGVTP